MKTCECGAKIRARGMCHNHYEQWRKRNPLSVVDRSGRWGVGSSRAICLYPECRGLVRTQGLCMPHYQSFYYYYRKGLKDE